MALAGARLGLLPGYPQACLGSTGKASFAFPSLRAGSRPPTLLRESGVAPPIDREPFPISQRDLSPCRVPPKADPPSACRGGRGQSVNAASARASRVGCVARGGLGKVGEIGLNKLDRPSKRPSVPCPETCSRTASITATATLPSLHAWLSRENEITVSLFRLSDTDERRRNNAVALIRQLTGSIQELGASRLPFHSYFDVVCGNRDVKTPSYRGNIRFSPCEGSDAFLDTTRAGHKAV